MGAYQKKNKVLIFVVAYNAENHIRSVINRLPKEVFNNKDFHILVIDDCSKDETAKVASAHVHQLNYENVSILRNTINQGYGGNQKLGYRYAIEHGFGLAILLHGDGQYAPELVLEFVKRWKEDDADVILGSRMMQKANARAGGMPFYKWVGNQVLTAFQNQMVGSKLSEFHTGYRAYDTDFLSRIPFELNTNDFHFDTEILLQGFALEAKVSEFAIPTHYGDEICHVNGMKYAWDVAKACLKYRSQKVGFFCSMQYRGLLDRTERYEDRTMQQGSIYENALKRVKPSSRVLLLGDGSTPKFLLQSLKSQGCQVVPSEMSKDQYERGKTSEDLSKYDYVLALNLLEKMDDSERFLVNCRYNLSGQQEEQPHFIFSTKNVAFFGLRILLGLGLFNYGERGILTVNTKRLFTLASFRRMLSEAGFVESKVHGIGVPFQLLFSGQLGQFLARFSNALARLYPSMFAYEFVIEAKAKPHAFMVLSKAEKFYEANPPATLGV